MMPSTPASPTPMSTAGTTPVGGPTTWRRPSEAGAVIVLFRRLMSVGIRQPVFGFIFPIVFPVVLVVFVSAMFARIAKLPGFPLDSYSDYLAPGIVMLIPMIGSGYGSSTLIEDFRTGFVDRLRLQGVTAQSVVLAKILFEMARIVPAGLIVSALVVVMGAPLRSGLLTIVLLMILMCGWSAAYSSLFYIVGVRTLNPQAPLALLPLVLPLLFLSDALMPTAFLAPWLQVAIQFNPFTHIVDAAASIMRGPTDWNAIGRGILSLVVVFVGLQLVLRRLISRRIGT
jgi:ABC-2 type transport system permease protein